MPEILRSHLLRAVGVALLAAATGSILTNAQNAAPARPPITGIDHVAFLVSSQADADKFYGKLLGFTRISMSGDTAYTYPVSSAQNIETLTGPEKHDSRLDHFAFATTDAEALRKYLKAKGVKVPDTCGEAYGGGLEFAVKDPEGNPVEFVQRTGKAPVLAPLPISKHLIHVGMVVQDPTLENKFYQDILGFHLLWKGGMKEELTDWVSMQVPDGTDWLEYMLNIKPDASAETRGVMNHMALGVKDIQAADAKLKLTGWTPTQREHPQMGRDGKWQLNLYDPYGTRSELMEFKPVGKICCSPYTATLPTE